MPIFLLVTNRPRHTDPDTTHNAIYPKHLGIQLAIDETKAYVLQYSYMLSHQHSPITNRDVSARSHACTQMCAARFASSPPASSRRPEGPIDPTDARLDIAGGKKLDPRENHRVRTRVLYPLLVI
jgi:hypothetical protein